MNRIQILLPTYNRLRWLPECVAGIMGQQDAGDFHLNILDNGSNDGTAAYLANISEDTRITVTTNPVNRLGEFARMISECADDDYVALFCDDDLMMQGHLASHRKILDENPNLGMVFSSVDAMNEGGHFMYEEPKLAAADLMTGGLVFEKLIMKDYVPTPAVLFRAHLFKPFVDRFDCGGFESCGDWDFWLEAANRGIDAAYIRKSTVRIRYHDNQHSNRLIKSKQSIEEHIMLWLKWHGRGWNPTPEQYLFVQSQAAGLSCVCRVDPLRTLTRLALLAPELEAEVGRHWEAHAK